MRKKAEAVKQGKNIKETEVLPSENGFKASVDSKVTNGVHKNEEFLNGNKAASQTKDDIGILVNKSIAGEQLTDRPLTLLPTPNLDESTNGDTVEASGSQADTAFQLHMDEPSTNLQITESPCEALESDKVVSKSESFSDDEPAASGFFTAAKKEDGQISECDTITQGGFEEPTNQDEFLSLLRSDFLGCSVCHDRQNDALLLPCLHVVCNKCIGSHTDSKHCRICRPLEYLGDQSSKQGLVEVHSSPEDLFLKSLRRLAGLVQNEAVLHCDCCQLESQTSKSEYRCVECGDNLCEPCRTAHKRTKHTRLHTLLSFKELRRTSLLTRTHQVPPTLCMDHNQANQVERDSVDPMALAVFNFAATSEIPQACAYCETCGTILCAACSGQFLGSRMKTIHTKHKVVALETKVEEIRSQLGHGLNALVDKKDAFQNYLQCIAEYASDLDSLISNVNNEIDRRSTELHSKIDEVARQLKQIAVNRVEDELGELNKYRDPLDPFIAQCDVAQRYAKTLQDYGRPEELIPIAAFVLRRLDYLNSQQFREIKAKLQPVFHKGEFPLDVAVEEEESIAGTNLTERDRARRYLFGYIQFNRDPSSTTSPQQLPEEQNKTQSDIPESISISCNSVGVNTSSEADFDDWTNGRMMQSPNFKFSQTACGTSTRTALATQCSILTKSQAERPRHSRLITEVEFDSRVVTDTRDVWPTGVALNPSSSHIFVVDRDNAKIKIFSPSGKFLSSFGDSPNESVKMISPFDVAVTPSGLVLVSDYQLQEVRLFSLDGTAQGTLSQDRFSHPRGIGFGMGMVGVLDSRRRHIALFDPRSNQRTALRRINMMPSSIQDAPRGTVSEPYYVDFVEVGSGYLAVTDYAAPSVKMYSLGSGVCVGATGDYGTGAGQVLQPHGISYSPWNNELLVADHANHRIQSCPIQLSSNQGTWTTIPEETYHRVGYSDGYLNLGSLKPVAEKSTNAVWHPMAIAVDVHHHRIIVSEALGSIKVLKSTR
ncbi:hypothetical protein CRM22_005543 [Opisthorchis felineus]|uniref:RING-type domain-containing protein n=1 Tax=Opisthorchis felineus TaxID=147828 RepID=A0A4S2LQK9_OPIFE|nr:hypothetical protein CRM22_005543 [Opisthorchis felineus]